VKGETDAYAPVGGHHRRGCRHDAFHLQLEKPRELLVGGAESLVAIEHSRNGARQRQRWEEDERSFLQALNQRRRVFMAVLRRPHRFEEVYGGLPDGADVANVPPRTCIVRKGM
jgi:hypothetical protein